MDKAQLQHSLIAALKSEVASQGQLPSRDSFLQHTNFKKHDITLCFGGYKELCEAAGLEHTKASRKIDQSIFQQDLGTFTELANQEVPALVFPEVSTLAVISDIHFPFESQAVLNRFYEYVGDEKPEAVVINGDAWDFYSHSKFPRSHNVFTPKDEQTTARLKNEQFWLKVDEACPGALKFQMLGNHDVRPMKRILESYPEAADWVEQKLRELFTYPGVQTIYDVRQELTLGNMCIFHGYRSKLGEHRDYTLRNCVNGHTHVGGVVFRKLRGEVIWELNSGLAGNPEAKGLTYTPQKIVPWTPGFGVVNEYGPQFVSV